MKRVSILLAFLYGFTCHAQNITYDDLSSVDWNDHPFSVVEMLLDKGFVFSEKRELEDIFVPGEETSESLYELSYGYLEGNNLVMGAFVGFDESNSGNLTSSVPVLKLVFMHESKNGYTEICDSIKKACAEPDTGFYFAPNSIAYSFKKEIVEGKPAYYIYIDYMTKEEFEAMKKKLNELIEMMNE